MSVARYSIGGIMRNYITREDIIKAFENNEFKVYIQPRYNIYTKEVIGGEALVKMVSWKKRNVKFRFMHTSIRKTRINREVRFIYI